MVTTTKKKKKPATMARTIPAVDGDEPGATLPVKEVEKPTEDKAEKKSGQGRPPSKETIKQRELVKAELDSTADNKAVKEFLVSKGFKKATTQTAEKIRIFLDWQKAPAKKKKPKGNKGNKGRGSKGSNGSAKVPAKRGPKPQANTAPDNLGVFVAAADFIELMGGVDRAIAALNAAKRLQGSN